MIVFALLLRSLSAAEVLLALRRMHLGWLVPLFVLVALGEFTRALKWHVILAPIRRIAILRLYGAIMIGYLANLVVPLRVSPLIRAAVIRAGRGTNAPRHEFVPVFGHTSLSEKRVRLHLLKRTT